NHGAGNACGFVETKIAADDGERQAGAEVCGQSADDRKFDVRADFEAEEIRVEFMSASDEGCLGVTARGGVADQRSAGSGRGRAGKSSGVGRLRRDDAIERISIRQSTGENGVVTSNADVQVVEGDGQPPIAALADAAEPTFVVQFHSM